LAIDRCGLFVRKWDQFGWWRGLYSTRIVAASFLHWSARRPSKPQRSAFSLTPGFLHFEVCL
jgi:hypothetical protein